MEIITGYCGIRSVAVKKYSNWKEFMWKGIYLTYTSSSQSNIDVSLGSSLSMNSKKTHEITLLTGLFSASCSSSIPIQSKSTYEGMGLTPMSRTSLIINQNILFLTWPQVNLSNYSIESPLDSSELCQIDSWS